MRPTDLVLLSNDDGYASPGLEALRTAFSAAATTVVVAPETEQSATSHSLSLHRPLRLRAVTSGVFAIDGTPADCWLWLDDADYLRLRALSHSTAVEPGSVAALLERLLGPGAGAGAGAAGADWPEHR